MRRILLPLMALAIAGALAHADEPVYRAELIFPLEHWHNHGSCIVEAANGDLIACWFHGSGERQSDDVVINGARKPKGAKEWTKPFVLADSPDLPDTNCCMIIDPKDRLWLLWPAILANTWESALMKYKVSSDYLQKDGPPKWDYMDNLLIKQGDDFPDQVKRKTEEYLGDMKVEGRIKEWVDHNYAQAADKLTRRLGWFTRAHPKFLPDGRFMVGLYSDGFSFSLNAYSDDLGQTWKFSEPIVGGGNIQPSFATKKDGTIVAFMRDNGPPPKRVMVSESKDRGETWSKVEDHPTLENPGAGLELANIANGDWVCIYNDHPQGRHTLAVSISEDEGKTWKWTRHLERTEPKGGSFHYPSIVQGKDGMLHASYTYSEPDALEGKEGKSIKYATFNKAWVMEGDPK